ncbi:retinol dehydrogenase 11-like isoform X1 [Cylas formicarius]|uniref:retinol dehydrogenase 11-like isoform X1 n=1 Tax=Cylas formicarius TaxID=197179 RepID=UPI00295856E6|nr:retinol dehydrogenase 11-like isoform X1 [Cylas formicarius]
MGWFNAMCTSVARLDGKTAVITGCNTGIGKVTVQDFFERGARVIMACRNREKATQAAEEIKQATASKSNLGEIIVEELDLMSLKSVRSCAEKILAREKRIDLLINNAGVMTCPYGKTEDGFEIQFGTNHLGHFLLTLLLLPRICQSTPARIVNVSSVAHERGTMNFDDLNWEKTKYNPIKAYGQSKLANILFTKELDRRLKEAGVSGVNVYSLHPGVINTELSRHVGDTFGKAMGWIYDNVIGCFIKSAVEGAQTTIYCAVDEKCARESGLYYAECAVKTPKKNALNMDDASKLWDESLKLVDLPLDYNPFK